MKINLLIVNGWGFNKNIFDKLLSHFDFEYEIDFIIPSLDRNFNNLEDKNFYKLIKENTILITWSLGFAYFFKNIHTHNNEYYKDNILAIIAISPSPCFINNNAYTNGWDKKILDKMIIKLDVNPSVVMSDFSFNCLYDLNHIDQVQSNIINYKIKEENQLSKSLSDLSNIDITNKIKDIDTDILIIHGKNDKIISVKNSIWLSKFTRNSTLKLINDCGHIPHFEKDILSASYINKFIKQIRSRHDR